VAAKVTQASSAVRTVSSSSFFERERDIRRVACGKHTQNKKQGRGKRGGKMYKEVKGKKEKKGEHPTHQPSETV
jgi:hypothetical protein